LNLLKPVFTVGLAVGFVALNLTTISVQADHSSDHSIAARISKVGSVCVEGEKCKMAVAVTAPAVTSGPRSGTDIYTAACAACHDSGVAGAPKVGDASAWAQRITKGTEMLVANAINGINAMPARGLCMDCSDDEIKAAVEYMLNGSK
jgi:cytochrome c5